MAANNRKSKIWNIQTDQFLKIVKQADSYSDICRLCGLVPLSGNHDTAKRRVIELQADTSHFGKNQRVKNIDTLNSIRKVIPLKDILVKDSVYHRGSLKRRLITEGLLVERCSKCGLENIWNNEPITLQLDHINGDNIDNRIENLRLLCPNCHSQTETFGSRNITGKYSEKKYCSICNIQITNHNKSGMCVACNNKSRAKNCACGNRLSNSKSSQCKSCSDKENGLKRRKIDRPSKELILELVKVNGYSSVGRMYNVSDNAVRKWLK